METPRSTVATILWLLFGPIVWATHLTTIYAAHALLCARGAVDAPASVAIVATILALTFMAAAAKMAARPREAPGRHAEEQSFHRRVMLWLTALSALAVVWAGTAAAVIPACTPLR
jgi:hypothetical protein